MEANIQPGMVEVFCRYIKKNGRIIYPQNAKFFHFWVEEKEESDSNDDLVRNPMNNN